MKTTNFYTLILPFILISCVFLTRCAGDTEDDPIIDNPTEHLVPAQITSPANGDQFDIDAEINVSVKINRPNAVSNLEIYVNDTLYKGDLEIKDQTITIITNDLSKVGWTQVRLSYTDDQGKLRGDNREIVFFSDIVPDEKKAVIVNTYHHDKTSYTQGLEFHKGKLYEGTGQYNKSIIAEVDLKTGNIIRQHDIDASVFGEGITILNDTIYEISYKAQICYVYDMDFNLITSYTYEGEGWGLCNDGEYLIMSNGSSEIVWRDRKTFKIVKSIYVFDDDDSIVNLNELELINGKLFANIYRENTILEIDLITGKVLTNIDCSDIERDAFEFGMDVLNGIAYNPETGKTYVTGKLWSNLYEVSFE